MKHFSCGTYYDRIGENVRKIRMEKGLTQERLAEKTELSLTVIQKVEAGQGGIRVLAGGGKPAVSGQNCQRG